MLIDELKKNETSIILDTNVLLKIYKYQPEMIDFSLKCLYKIEEYILLPLIVCSEYENHHYEHFSRLKKKYKNMKTDCIKPLKKFSDSITRVLDNEKKEKQFVEIDDLKVKVMAHCDKIEELINDFIDKYDNDNSTELNINKDDMIKRFYDTLLSNNRILSGFNQSDIYNICLNGEIRYKKKIPPGFGDTEKGGLRQFSDLILWKEVIKYSKENGKNIILISNDEKNDWRDQTTNKLLPDLEKEFTKETNLKIECYSSSELFRHISDMFKIQESEHIAHMIDLTNENYCKRISDRVYETIQDKIEEFIINNNDSNNIGSEGLEDIYIDGYEYEGFNEVQYSQDEIEYFLIFSVKARGTSKDFWIKDDEDIFSPEKQHFFEGTIEVVVYRAKSDIEDVGTDDSFTNAHISAAYFEETKYISEFDAKGSLEYALNRYKELNKEKTI